MSASISNSKIAIKWALSLLLLFLIILIPETELFTHQIKLYFSFTTLIIMIVAFEFLPLLIPSVMLPSLYYIFNVVPASVAFSGWIQPITYMLIGAFALANALDECGLLKRIAFWCIRRCGGTYNGTLYGIFITGIILAFVTFNNAYVIVVTLAYGICKAMGYEKSKEAAIIMMAGALGATAVGAFTYYPVFISLIKVGATLVIPNFDILWYQQTIYNFPMFFFCLFYIWLLTKMYKTKSINAEKSKTYFDEEYRKMGKMTAKEKKASVVVIALMVFLFTNPIHKIDSTYGFMTLPWLLFLPGMNVGTIKSINKLDFGVFAFMVACLGIGTVGMNLGVNNLISAIITPVLSNMGVFGILYCVLFFGIAANLCMTPGAMLSCFAAPITQIAVSLNINPIAPLFTMIYACDLVFLPYEVTVLLVMFSFGMMSMSDFVKFSTLKVGLFLIYFGAIQIPVWTLLGLI